MQHDQIAVTGRLVVNHGADIYKEIFENTDTKIFGNSFQDKPEFTTPPACDDIVCQVISETKVDISGHENIPEHTKLHCTFSAI